MKKGAHQLGADWYGFSIRGKPLVGVSGGRLVFGTKGIVGYPSLEEVRSGWQPVTKLEANFYGTREALLKMGMSNEEMDREEITLVWENLSGQYCKDLTFRCDVCKFVHPFACLCGVVVNAIAERDHPRTYVLCSVCAVWLGFGKLRFPQGLCFNFTELQVAKIKALHKELEIVHKELKIVLETSILSTENDNMEKGVEQIHDFVVKTPNVTEIIQMRFRLLSDEIRELSDRLTRGEFPDPYEIEKANN